MKKVVFVLMAPLLAGACTASTPNPAADGLPGAVTKFGNCTGCAGYTRADISWGHFGPRLGFA